LGTFSLSTYKTLQAAQEGSLLCNAFASAFALQSFNMADDNGPPMTITMVVLTIVSLLFMTLRFYCKQALSTKLGLDDVVLAFSWVSIWSGAVDSSGLV
jgi:hypothetical protein